MRRILVSSLLLPCFFGCEDPALPTATLAPMTLVVDARETAAGRLHNHLVIPARPGELKLDFPKWIPGEHAPNGPISDLVGLRFTAGGKPLAWRRNAEEMYEIAVTVPAGAQAVEVDFDTLRAGSVAALTSNAAGAHFVDVVWNQAVLYPKGARSSAVLVDAAVKLPAGFAFASALPGAKEQNGVVSFGRVTLETLVDSPLYAGDHLKTFDLGTLHGAPHRLVLAGDDETTTVPKPEYLDAVKRLPAEALALFGARHYDGYQFLVYVSETTQGAGLEHHQSSEDYFGARAFIDADVWRVDTDTLAHEMTHSWNGKYRRPKGLATPDFLPPMRGDLLWVYEGLTQYLGVVLAARAGFSTPEDRLTSLAGTVRWISKPGRQWRPLVDTAISVQNLFAAPESGSAERRSADYYGEGLLIWLEADVLIRQKTNGARSLDDFCQRFFGGKDTSPEVRPYELEEVVKTLDGILANDWKAFFDQRVYRVAPEPPLAGLFAAGYKLGTSDKKPERIGLSEKAYKYVTYDDTLGFSTNDENVVRDVDPSGPARRAGLAAGEKILAVDGRKLSREIVEAALTRAKADAAPIEILTERDGVFRTVKIDYHGGVQWKTVERDPTKPDLLAAIFASKAGGK